MKNLRNSNKGITRILETIIAATIILIAFSAASFFLSDQKTSVVQNRADLDRLGYNVLSKLVESGTIEETVEQTTPAYINLKAFIGNSLPSSMLFNLTVSKCTQGTVGNVVTIGTAMSVSNTEDNALSEMIAVSSTP
ncbi:MAG TPA: hypothetical protein VLH35_08690 [Candidatus Acidoferrales bacterium]|nr:hypothetical protein [Candidatus Acidoferrales bacterium]